MAQVSRLKIFYSGAALELFGLGAVAMGIASIFPLPQDKLAVGLQFTATAVAQVSLYTITSNRNEIFDRVVRI